MLAMGGKSRLLPCFRQGGDGERLHVHAIRIGVTERVGRVVPAAFEKFRDDLIDDRRINERAVGRHANNGSRFEMTGRLVVTIQHVIFAAAETCNLRLGTERDDGVVGAARARSPPRRARPTVPGSHAPRRDQASACHGYPSALYAANASSSSALARWQRSLNTLPTTLWRSQTAQWAFLYLGKGDSRKCG